LLAVETKERRAEQLEVFHLVILADLLQSLQESVVALELTEKLWNPDA
jgi:hypothetical protein